MAAAPVNGEEGSGLRLTKNELKTPKPVEADLTIAQLSTSKTSPPAPFTPSTPSSGKRKKLKPARYDVSSTSAEKKHSPSKLKAIRDPPRTCLSFRKEKAATKDFDTPVQTSPAMIRAGEVQSSLGTDYPSFIKMMVRSHVASCFWMGLPVPFCKSFLPKHESPVVVEDENGMQYNLKFIAYKSGLSAGWRKFSVAHNLLEGDVLVFQLVASCKFKVYIVRANDPKEIDGALNLLNHEAHTEHMSPATITSSPKSKGRKHARSLPLTMAQKKHKRSVPPTQLSSHPMDHTSEGVGAGVPEGSPKPELLFKEVKTFEDFHIVVNGQCIDSELSEEIRMNYYKLCLDKKEFLHDLLPEGMYYKLVAGMIGETVSIANEIRNCKVTTTKEEFELLDNSLKSFELLGMKVGFLRDRIRKLETLVFESEDVKRYLEAKEEQDRTAYAIKVLEAKLVELQESSRKIDVVVGGLKENAERYEFEFLEKVNAPW